MQSTSTVSQPPGKILVCFALKEEAGPFQNLVAGRQEISLLITGIGKTNAEKSLREWLQRETPRKVFTCGFAGGLHPDLKLGDVVFSTLQRSVWDALQQQGAKSGYIYTADRICTTAAEKAELRQKTHQDAVEMESGHIQQLCRERKIPCTTVRVISDTAQEDLPLDFNQLSQADASLSFGKLAWTLLKSPGKIPALLRLRKRTQFAAQRLADVLVKVV